MKRERYKFLAGSVAGLAFAHVAWAVAASRGILSEPIFLGRKWKVKYMWVEAAAYSAASLALGYFGWFSKPREELQESRASATE